MGVVYRGEHLETGAAVALKTVRAPSEDLMASIRREMHTLGRLRHPGIARILETGISGGMPWYAMELIQGETLRGSVTRLWPRTPGASVTASRRPGGTAPLDEVLPLDEALPARRRVSLMALTPVLSMIRALCAPLAFLHGEGLVHRDLKPENVFVRTDRRTVLVDLGITASFGGGLGREELSAEAIPLGTLPYMAPEQIKGELVDARADLYSLGCMLYECLTGRPPFTGASAESILFQQLNERPRPVSELMEGLPEGLDLLVLRLLAKRPEERLGYAHDVAELLGELGIEAQTEKSAPRSRPYLYRPGLEGRAAILEELQEALEPGRPEAWRLVLVAGESGVGKTRVAMELAQRAARRGIRVITGQCAALGVSSGEAMTAVPFLPLRPVLLSMADRCRERGAEETRRLFGSGGKLLALYEPFLASLPGMSDLPDPPTLPPEASRRRILAALSAALAAFSEDKRLLLILDDLQWADELSLDFLKELAAASGQVGGPLVLGIYRTEERQPKLAELASARGTREFMLGRLDGSSVEAMVSGMLALQRPPPELVEFLASSSEGNPFFIAEYLRAAIGEGLLTRDRTGAWRLRTGEAAPLAQSVPLPRTLEELIDRRLAALSGEGLLLVEWASILGREFDDAVLMAVAGVNEILALETFEALRVRQIIEETAVGRLRFAHDKIREVSYRRVPLERRRVMHRRVAFELEAHFAEAPDVQPELGHHFAQAELHDRAALCFGRAAERARAAHVIGQAIWFYQAAIAELRALEPEPRGAAKFQMGALYEGLGEVLALSGRQPEAQAAYREGLTCIEPSSGLERARLHRRLGMTWQMHHAHDSALEAYRNAEESLEVVPVRSEEWWDEWLQIQMERCHVNYWRSDAAATAAIMSSVRPILEARGTADRRAQFYRILMQLQLNTERYLPSAETLGYCRASLEAYRELGKEWDIVASRFNLAILLLWRGDLDEAGQELRGTLAEVERLGDLSLLSRGLAYEVVLHRRRRSIQATRTSSERAIEVSERTGMKEYLGVVRANLGWCSLREGRMQECVREGEAALALWKAMPATFPLQWMALLPLAAVAFEQHRLEDALAHMRAVLEVKQQRLPEELSAALEVAIAMPETEPLPLQKALKVATHLGFL